MVVFGGQEEGYCARQLYFSFAQDSWFGLGTIHDGLEGEVAPA